MSITPETVSKLLSSENLGDRLQAVNQIEQLPPAIAFDLARKACVDNNARVRYAAVSKMAHLGQEDIQTALNLLRDRLHNDPEVDVQAAAADSLGALKLTEAFDDLEKIYHNTKEWLLQISIVAAIGEMGEPRAFTLLETALNSDNSLVQTMAISALGELGNTKAIPLLIQNANNSDWQIRYRVAQALARLGGDEARATLEILAKDESETVAAEATNYLRSIAN